MSTIPVQMPQSDHDLLIAINTKMDIYIAQQKETAAENRAQINKLWEEKARQADMTKALADLAHLDQVKASKGDHKALSDRVGRLELRAAVATGILIAVQFFVHYLIK